MDSRCSMRSCALVSCRLANAYPNDPSKFGRLRVLRVKFGQFDLEMTVKNIDNCANVQRLLPTCNRTPKIMKLLGSGVLE